MEIKSIIKVVPDINVGITVDGKEVNLDVKPYIYSEEKESVLVPLRFITEALGFGVEWNGNDRQILLNYEGKAIIIEIEKGICYVDGEAIELEIAPEIHDDRTYVSLEFIIEALGANFEYLYQDGAVKFEIK